MWCLGLQAKAEEGALGVSEKQTFLGHLMLQRWVIGPLDVLGIKYETPWVKSVLRFTVSHSIYTPFFLSTRAVSVALGTAMTTSQSNILVQLQVFWQWVNPTSFRPFGARFSFRETKCSWRDELHLVVAEDLAIRGHSAWAQMQPSRRLSWRRAAIGTVSGACCC